MTPLQHGATVGPEDREAWLAARRSGLGGSEAAAVMGVCPYTSPRELYARKLGIAPDVEESEAMRRGSYMEPFLAAEYRRRFPECPFREQVFLRHPEYPFLFATLDGLRDDGVVIEFKTANRRTAMKWGEEHSDEIPESYLCQVQHQLAVSGGETAHVWVSIGGDDCTLYTVPRHEAFIERLVFEARAFWRHVEDRDPPPATRAQDAKLHHLLYPEPTEAIRLDEEAATLVEEWVGNKLLKAHHEKRVDTLKAMILGRMGGAEAGHLPDGCTLTRKTITRDAYTCSFQSTTYTDLRIKKARANRGD